MKQGNISLLFVVLLLWSITGCAMFSKTALMETTAKGDTAGIQKLLNQGANIDEADIINEITPLMYAICKNQTQTAKALVKLGADFNIQDKYGYSALFYAIIYGNKEMTIFLLENGADVNARNLGGETALHIAIGDMNYEIVRLLVEKGADINAENSLEQTPLHYTAMYHKQNTKNEKLIIDYLLSKNAKADIKDSYGWTALRYAVYYKSVDIVAAIRKKTNWSERTWYATSYRYKPETGLFAVKDDERKQYEYALYDCTLLSSFGQDNLSEMNAIAMPAYKEKFISCMDKMGFKANQQNN